MMVSPESINRFEVAASGLFVILAIGGEAAIASFFSNAISLLSIAIVSIFFLITLLYLFPQSKSRKSNELVLHLLFAADIAVYALITLEGGPALPIIAGTELSFLLTYGEFFTLFIPLMFLIFIGTELYREQENRKAAAALFGVALLITILYFASKFLVKSITLNDEVYLMFQSANLTLRGINPYSVSLAHNIFTNATQIGGSVTTYNKIIGVIDYPALFFLAFIPFYFASPPSLTNLSHVDLPLQALAFLFIAIASLAFSLDRQKRLKPSMLLLAFFVIGVVVTVSTNTYLMMALLLLAYVGINSRYAWIPLGLCVSLQEELWIPVLLLLAYSFNNSGFKRGTLNALGTLAVFLVINAYFLFPSPAGFFSAIFPLNNTYLPNGTSPLGFFLLRSYPILFSTYTQLVEIAIAAVALITMYANRKGIIPLLSLAPFMFWQHSLPAYDAFFIFFVVFAIVTMRKERKSKGVIEEFLKSRRTLFWAALLVLAFSGAFLVYASHSAYVRGFNVSVVSESLTGSGSTRSSTFDATLVYHGLANSTVYLYAIYYSGSSYDVAGLFGQNLINATPACSDYECMVNVNRIDLPRNSSSYRLHAVIPWGSATMPVRYVDLNLYNGEYYYVSPSIYNSSA